MQWQSIAKMLLKALYRLKFGLSYLDSIKIPTAKKVAKNGLFCYFINSGINCGYNIGQSFLSSFYHCV
jgi:hypothetical protein